MNDNKYKLPVLSVISPSDVLLIKVTPLLPSVNDKFILNFSGPSTTLSTIIGTLPLPSVTPALIVILNGSESKSIREPMYIRG